MMTNEEKLAAFFDWLDESPRSLQAPAPLLELPRLELPRELPRLERFDSDFLGETTFPPPRLERMITENQSLDGSDWLEPLEQLPELPPPPPLTRSTNQKYEDQDEEDEEDEHKNCEHAPCACCVNGILIEITFIEDGSIPMCDWVKAHRLAHLKKLLSASLYYPLEPPEMPKLVREAS